MKKIRIAPVVIAAALLQNSAAAMAQSFLEIENLSSLELLQGTDAQKKPLGLQTSPLGGVDAYLMAAPRKGGGSRGGGSSSPPPSRPSSPPPRQSPPPPRQQPPQQRPPQQQPPQQQPPRQQPPAQQQPPKQQPPQQRPPQQQPPRQQPPQQQPPRQQPPAQQQPPRQQPPAQQQPPKQQPPPQQPPKQQPPPQQKPPQQQPPQQRPPQQTPSQQPKPQAPASRPPVITRPAQPQPLPKRPEPIRDPGKLMDPNRNGHDIRQPVRFGDGRPVTQRPIVGGPRGNHVTIINNRTVLNNINVYNRTEIERNRYYWHEYGGYRYCHYYDYWGYHWYGWYIGDVYFWTRYYNDYYWWYDPYWHRWCYMREGRWWWQDPVRVNVVYIYAPEYNNYYQYNNSNGGVVLQPEPAPSQPAQPTPAPQPPSDEKVFYSEDGTRSVRIVSDRQDAFLYDLTATDQSDPKSKPVYLASGVKDVKFGSEERQAADGSTNKNLKQIVLVFSDETSSAVVDIDGTRKVQTFGDKKEAYLYDLTKSQDNAKLLAGGVKEVALVTAPQGGSAGGAAAEKLKYIQVTVVDADQNETTLLFDPDGNAVSAQDPGSTPAPEAATPPAGPSSADEPSRLNIQTTPLLQDLDASQEDMGGIFDNLR